MDPTAVPRPAPQPGVAFAEPPPATPPATTPASDVKVELTAVTLADDCGGHAPSVAPAAERRAAKADMADVRGRASARRRCEQTSMQLAISASATAKIQIKSVELLDERGASLGTLVASKPTRWSDTTGTYDAWDETLAANTPVSVSYVLQQPNWSKIGNRWNRTYTLKTIVTIGGVDRAVNKEVTLTAPTQLPPNVRT